MVSTPKHLAQVIVNQLNFLPPSYWGDPTPLSMDIIYIHLYTSFHHNILGCSHPSQFVSFSQYFWGAPTPLISDSFDLLCSNYLVRVGLNLIIVSIPDKHSDLGNLTPHMAKPSDPTNQAALGAHQRLSPPDDLIDRTRLTNGEGGRGFSQKNYEEEKRDLGSR